jgi:hypothetical protein
MCLTGAFPLALLGDVAPSAPSAENVAARKASTLPHRKDSLLFQANVFT